jgi:hypothetical protein
VIESGGLAVEAILWGLSVSLVWGLQMRLSKRVLILGAFGSRLLLFPLVVFRLRYLAPEENANGTITSILPQVLTEATLEYAVSSEFRGAPLSTCRTPFCRGSLC